MNIDNQYWKSPSILFENITFSSSSSSSSLSLTSITITAPRDAFMELSSQHRSISGYLIKNRGSNGSSKKIIPNIPPPLSFRLFDGIPVGDINVLFSLFFKLGCIRRYFSIGGFISTRNNAWGLSGFHLSSFMNTQPSITALPSATKRWNHFVAETWLAQM